jgi:aspartyl-tRNA(Asn)/glutamyl-tRNA(Gln) amidotransferase subunit B
LIRPVADPHGRMLRRRSRGAAGSLSGMPTYEPVIGLEVHAQLKTRSKIFCPCSTEYGAPPNSRTCPVCLGHPGALPVLNRGAVELAVRCALALGCTVHATSVFARKNYFYPDLPKGYQITQYEAPLATGGQVQIESGGQVREIPLVRLHLEEDAGKSVHDGMPDSHEASYVDLNRAGVPLVEIVSAPEIHSPLEAYLYLQRLRSVLRYAEVCDGNLEEGSLRCDANVSLRAAGGGTLGTRTELKNLNSFRNVQRALEYEISRQAAILEQGGAVEQETLLWDAPAGETRPLRGKEEAEDYRYFPEPDLRPLVLDPAWIDEARSSLPELPAERKARLLKVYGISEADAHLLTLESPLADYYEQVARSSGNPRAAANFIVNDLLREQKLSGRDEAEIPLPADRLAELIRLADSGVISVTQARALFEEVYRTGRSPAELVRERGMEQIRDEGTLRQVLRDVLDAHPDTVAQYRKGRTKVLGFLVGQAMKASGGKADPAAINELLREMLR